MSDAANFKLYLIQLELFKRKSSNWAKTGSVKATFAKQEEFKKTTDFSEIFGIFGVESVL